MTDFPSYPGNAALRQDDAGKGLSPCPFCGSRCVTLLNGGPGNYFVRCDDCLAASNDVQRDHAIEIWNRRSGGAAQASWMPIETAPKDGTAIEVCNTRHPSDPPVIVRWTENPLSEDLPEPHWCDAATACGEALYYNGRYFDFWKPTTALPSTEVK